MPLELSWESFRDAYLRPGVPGVHVVPGKSAARVFVDSGGARIGLWLPLAEVPPSLPTSGRTLSIRPMSTEFGACLEVATSVGSLFEQFLTLARDIVARAEAGDAPVVASTDAIRAWRELLKERARLSSEEEVGLWGELWFLDHLLGAGYDAALDAWTGPRGDPHDFRFGKIEVEVKTSTGTRRHHIISSLEQLIPSPNHALRLLSVLVGTTADGTGATVVELAQKVLKALPATAADNFGELLERRGVTKEDADLFTRRFTLRAEPEIAAVDDEFPVLSRARVISSCGAEAAARVLSATYVVDVEGLGVPISASGQFPG